MLSHYQKYKDYYKQYYQENKQKSLNYSRQYYQKKRFELYEANKEKIQIIKKEVIVEF